jgi:hypothetical protein
MKKMNKSSGSSSQTTSHSDLSLWEEKLKAKPYAHFSAAANYYVAGLPYPPLQQLAAAGPPQQQLAAAGPPHPPQQQLAAAGPPHPPQQQLAAAGPPHHPQQQQAAAGPPHPPQQQLPASRLFPHQLASDADSYQYPAQRFAASSCDSSVVYYQQLAAGNSESSRQGQTAGNCRPSGPFYHYQQSSDAAGSSVQYYQQQAAGNCDSSMFHHQLPRAAGVNGSALPYSPQQPAAGKSGEEPVTLFIGGVPFYLLEAAGATGTGDLYEDVDSSDCGSDLGHNTTCLTSPGTSQCSSDLGRSSNSLTAPRSSQGSCDPGTSQGMAIRGHHHRISRALPSPPPGPVTPSSV